jgi:hypothetical protein
LASPVGGIKAVHGYYINMRTIKYSSICKIWA